VVKSIVLGERRTLEKIVIEVARNEDLESFPKYGVDQVLGLSREHLLAHLQDTGFLSFIRQRPFSKRADPTAQPKSIFVNAMSTAPFRPDIGVLVKGREAAFQAGLNALTRLTTGKVFLCLDAQAKELPQALTAAKNASIHAFDGPHPSGNTSVHIHHLDPIQKHQAVWTIKAADLIQIGRLLTEGAIPESRIVSLGGPGVKEGARKHYRVRVGESLKAVLDGNLVPGEQRVVSGDVLGGHAVPQDGAFRLLDAGLTVLPEGRERHFMGWIAPGLNVLSQSRTFLSRWLKPKAEWALDTNVHGSPRAMVLTGLYDRFMPMNIMVDFLVRAVLAHDTDEAVNLGLLEVDPEDFALCAFVCPSKMDLVGIIKMGLAEVEKEGI
jgi:Na+-transporting NADH:ubiquinone oxidoreductase subunit A